MRPHQETDVKWPGDFNDSDVQEGFIAGIAPEIQGLWFGDEKYRTEDGLEDYCSRAIINPQAYLTWESVNLKTCKDVGVIYEEGMIKEGNYLQQINLPGYIYRFRQKQCLPNDKCDEDITKDSDPNDTVQFGNYTLEAKACGGHLKDDYLAENTYTCELYQTSLISKIDEETGEKEYLVVAIFSYHFFSDNWDKYECPSKPSFLADFIAPNDGSARFVLQVPFNETITDPCSWDCFDDVDGKFGC